MSPAELLTTIRRIVDERQPARDGGQVADGHAVRAPMMLFDNDASREAARQADIAAAKRDYLLKQGPFAAQDTAGAAQRQALTAHRKQLQMAWRG